MTGALAVVLVLGGLIFFHELGHFLAARSLGMGIKTFSLGFGPRLLSFKPGRTRYQVAAVPLGGYVSLVGEEDKEDLPEEFSERHSFALRPAWQRFIVIIAGSMFNLLLAALIYWGLFWHNGMFTDAPVIGAVQTDSPAAAAGLEAGDRVLSIDGRPITKWHEISPAIQGADGREIRMEIERGDRRATLTLSPVSRPSQIDPKKKVWIVGLLPGLKPLSFFSAAKYGFLETWGIIRLTWESFAMLVKKAGSFREVAGPVGIAQMISRQSDQGLGSVLALAALISVNLGILNLLPIPVLDGGHAFFLAIEMIIRRPVPKRIQSITTKVGLVLLLGLMLLALYNDISRLLAPAA